MQSLIGLGLVIMILSTLVIVTWTLVRFGNKCKASIFRTPHYYVFAYFAGVFCCFVIADIAFSDPEGAVGIFVIFAIPILLLFQFLSDIPNYDDTKTDDETNEITTKERE